MRERINAEPVSRKPKRIENEIRWSSERHPGLLPDHRRSVPAADEHDAWIEYSRRVRAIVVGIVRRDTRVDADDVMQNVMKRAWEFRSGFRGDAQFSTWLYRIAVRAALGELEKVRNNVVSIEELVGPDPDAPSLKTFEPVSTTIDLQTYAWVDELLGKLSRREREMLLEWMHGESEQIMAKERGISYAAFRKQRSRLIQWLRDTCKDPAMGERGGHGQRKLTKEPRGRAGFPGAARNH